MEQTLLLYTSNLVKGGIIMINRIGLVIMLSIAIFFVGCQGTEVSNSKQQVSLNFEAQYIRTDGYNEGVDYPVVSLISSAQELEEYYTRNKESYNLESGVCQYSCR